MTTRPPRCIREVVFVLWCLVAASGVTIAQERWWQREPPAPSQNQVLNPAYLAKRRQLEQAVDALQKDRQARTHFQSLNQKTPALDNAVKQALHSINQLEHRLSQIPMYITRKPNGGSMPRDSAAPATPRSESTSPPVVVNVEIPPDLPKPPDQGAKFSSVHPSGVDRVIDEILNFMPNKSAEATERLRLALLLLPEGFDLRSSRLIEKAALRVALDDIQKGRLELPEGLEYAEYPELEEARKLHLTNARRKRVHQLVDTLKKYFKSAPGTPPNKPVKLTMGGSVRTHLYYDKGCDGTLYKRWMEGSYFVFDDGSREKLDKRWVPSARREKYGFYHKEGEDARERTEAAFKDRVRHYEKWRKEYEAERAEFLEDRDVIEEAFAEISSLMKLDIEVDARIQGEITKLRERWQKLQQ